MTTKVNRQRTMGGVFHFLSAVVRGEVTAIYFGREAGEVWAERLGDGFVVPCGNYKENTAGDPDRDQLYDQLCWDAFLRKDFWYDRRRHIISTSYNGFPAGGNRRDIVRFISSGQKFRWLLALICSDDREPSYNLHDFEAYETISAVDGSISIYRNEIMDMVRRARAYRDIIHKPVKC